MKNFFPLFCAALILAAAPAYADKARSDQTGAAPPAVQSTATAPLWNTVPIESTLTFSGTQMGTAFKGVFTSFTPEIYFDPSALDASQVVVSVDLASLDTQDAERDTNLKGSEFFNIKDHPTARFETTAITAASDDASGMKSTDASGIKPNNTSGTKYIAEGNLTIGGIAAPVTLPFTLDITKEADGAQQAVMTGTATLDRSVWKLGTGDWKDPSIIANDVQVDIKLTATRQHDGAVVTTPPPAPLTP